MFFQVEKLQGHYGIMLHLPGECIACTKTCGIEWMQRAEIYRYNVLINVFHVIRIDTSTVCAYIEHLDERTIDKEVLFE